MSGDEIGAPTVPGENSSAPEGTQNFGAQAKVDDQKSQHEKGLLEHGCKHYRRRCKLVAPCCGEVFWCRHCHNEVKAANEWDSRKWHELDAAWVREVVCALCDLEHPVGENCMECRDSSKRHELDRTRVREVVCALCDVKQPVGGNCIGCGVQFGAYACLKCCFFEDDTSKQQFHCAACGICRVGGVENFFHCHTCGCCYATSLQNNHVCVENSMRQNCPVCFEYLFDSVRPTAVLPCGHTIHSDCLREMERNRQLVCPICMKSYADLAAIWRRVDEEVASTPMPEEYACWVAHILCNDCNQAGQVPFHILGLKCPHCASYNTRRLTIDRNGRRQQQPPQQPNSNHNPN